MHSNYLPTYDKTSHSFALLGMGELSKKNTYLPWQTGRGGTSRTLTFVIIMLLCMHARRGKSFHIFYQKIEFWKLLYTYISLTRCYCILMWRSNFWLHTTWYSMFLSYKFKSTSDACLQIHLKMLNVAKKSKTKSHFVFVLVCCWTYLNNGLLTLCFFPFLYYPYS